MNKRVKMGPVLVAGALVMLVAVAVVLTPAPPPEEEKAANDEQQAAAKQGKQEAPKLDLDRFRKALASTDAHAQSEAMREIETAFLTARDAEKAEIGELVKEVAISSGNEAIRASAVDLARGFGQPDVEFFLRVAREDRSPLVKRSAMGALGSFPGNPEVEKTLKAFRNDLDPGLRSAAVIAWVGYLMSSGKAGDEELASLLGQYDNDMSAKVVMALSQHGAAALPALEKALYTGKTGAQRQAAALAIAVACAGFNPGIEAFARSAQVTHRQEAGHEPANLAGVKPLLWALQNDSWAPTREIAAQGLGYLGDARAARPLGEALKDPDRYVRRRAAAALMTVPAESVVPDLSAAATGDSDAEVRRFAVEALGWIGAPEAVPALLQATKDKAAFVRRYAALELGKLAEKKGGLQASGARDALAGLLGDQADADADVRWAAVVALGKLRDPQSEDVLVKCLSDASPQVQNSAERALQRLGVARLEEAGYGS